MSKRGRKRSNKEREPSGRVSRLAEKKANEEFGKWQRRHLLGLVPEDKLLDQKAATPLGALFLGRVISEEQYQAGEHYGEVVRRYRIVSGLPLDLPARLRMGARGVDNRMFPAVVVRRARAAYLGLRRRLLRSGRGVLSAVTRLVVDERPESSVELVKQGLKALGLKGGAG